MSSKAATPAPKASTKTPAKPSSAKAKSTASAEPKGKPEAPEAKTAPKTIPPPKAGARPKGAGTKAAPASKESPEPAVENPAPAKGEDPAETAEAASQAPSASSEKKSRVQMANVLHINISQARCATHLKHNLGDNQTETEIKERRKALKEAKGAQDAEKVAELKASIAELSKSLVRLSSDTPITTAVIMDNMVKELIRHGMAMAIASDRKIVEVSHLHEGDPTAMTFYPIFNKLPTFANYDAEHEEDLRKKRAADNKAAKEAREAKKQGGAKPAEDDAEDEHAEHTKTTFNTYVEGSLKAIKGEDEAYRAMRVSNRVREYLSEMTAEGLARFAMLSRIVVQQVVGVRTMNAEHIKAVVHLLMADEGRTDEQIREVKDQIDEKLKVYHDHLKAEREKKAAGMATEKKVELERKKLEADRARKKKQAETANRKASEAKARAEKLALESADAVPPAMDAALSEIAVGGE